MPNPLFKELRGVLDGSDPFMTGGHQIIKIPQSQRQTPDWVKNNATIQQVLLRAFPKLKTDIKQRSSAARWATVIQLHFRALMSYKQTAEQMGLSYATIQCMTRRISKMANTPTKRHRGRPK